MNLQYLFELFIFLLLLSKVLNIHIQININENCENNFNFEKSITHILKTESVETGNNFIIIFHSLNRNIENLNSLIKTLNNNDFPIFSFAQIESENM